VSRSSNPPNASNLEPNALPFVRAAGDRQQSVETIEGEVVRITYANDDTHFRVIRVRPFGRQESVARYTESDDTVKVVGKFVPHGDVADWQVVEEADACLLGVAHQGFDLRAVLLVNVLVPRFDQQADLLLADWLHKGSRGHRARWPEDLRAAC